MHGKWDTQYLTSILGSDSTNTLLAKKQATDRTNQLLTLISQSTDTEAINGVIKHLNAAIGIVKALSENPITQHLPKVKSICPNANSEKQQVFKSAKRKRSSQSQSIKKPGQVDFLNARQSLKSSTVIVCGICFQEDDNPQDLGQTTNTVEWIICNKCGVWVHESCSKAKTNDYTCPNCTTTNNE